MTDRLLPDVVRGLTAGDHDQTVAQLPEAEHTPNARHQRLRHLLPAGTRALRGLGIAFDAVQQSPQKSVNHSGYGTTTPPDLPAAASCKLILPS
jgi:hypothetical protein